MILARPLHSLAHLLGLRAVAELPLAALLLAGCAGPSPYIAPVEERSLVPVTPPPAGTVMPVEQSATVSVSPIYDAPSFTPAATAQPTPVPTQPAAEQAMPKVEQGSNTAVVALLGDARQAQTDVITLEQSRRLSAHCGFLRVILRSICSWPHLNVKKASTFKRNK